ncbi:SH3 domain-containing protein [Paraoerskovia marina]|uniref:SH3 domain-containing protein n=1 Tax=Paraoerskovia marina TaxID=545619 RepID=UPI000694F98F|nr:SH3 domain-containing protein [Paraoerskovia marina]
MPLWPRSSTTSRRSLARGVAAWIGVGLVVGGFAVPAAGAAPAAPAAPTVSRTAAAGDVARASSSTGMRYVNAASLVFRSGPSTRYPVVARAPQGKAVKLLGKSSGRWVYVQVYNKKRWVYSTYLSHKRYVASSTGMRFVNASSLNFRSGPSTGYSVVTRAPQGKAVKLLGKSYGGWVYVQVYGKKRWVYAKYLATKRYISTSRTRQWFSNGRLPASALCTVGWRWRSTEKISCKANKDLTRLNSAFRDRFGSNIPVDDGYRTYAQQVDVREEYGYWAAVPGTSNHGWGAAIDLPDYRFHGATGARYTFGATRYEWLKKNGPKYGWVNPAWAQKYGSKPEPWHFEYVW